MTEQIAFLMGHRYQLTAFHEHVPLLPVFPERSGYYETLTVLKPEMMPPTTNSQTDE